MNPLLLLLVAGAGFLAYRASTSSSSSSEPSSPAAPPAPPTVDSIVKRLPGGIGGTNNGGIPRGISRGLRQAPQKLTEAAQQFAAVINPPNTSGCADCGGVYGELEQSKRADLERLIAIRERQIELGRSRGRK